MRIEDLDEFQGLTADMVREWAEQKGYQYRTAGLWAPNGGFVTNANPERVGSEAWLIPFLAERHNLSVQALLREINPREREGVPSEAARQAHPGDWLVSGCLNESGEKHFEVWHSRNLHLASSYPYNPEGKRIACWPLDEHGNKVRWPERDGVML